jgi:inorganic triphosphatase YgiF
VELELKLLVEPADQRRIARLDPVRRLTAGPVRSQRLNNVYFDTPAFDLAAERVALRLRERPGRRGSTWVQTVKDAGRATGGLHEREELEWSVPGPRVDLALIDASPLADRFRRPRIRDALKPVFATDFRRSARVLRFEDGTTVELAMDVGEIRAGRRTAPIAEVELELIAGDPARLFDVAAAIVAAVPARVGHASKAERGYRLAHGARLGPPQKARPVELHAALTTAAALRRIMGACVEQMQVNEAGVLAGRDPEYLHQFRVGMRRLRSCLSVAALATGREAVAPLAAELRWLGTEMNPARDWDVFMTETLPPLTATFASVQGLDVLRRTGARLRTQHNRAVREALASRRYQALLLSLGALLAREDLAALRVTPAPVATDAPTTADATDAPASAAAPDAAAAPAVHPLDRPAGEFAATVLGRRDRRLRKRGAAVPEATPEARHEVRIAAKKLRYAAEFFASLYPRKRVARYARSLAGIQEILGALNDAAVVERLLAEAGARAALEPEATGLVRGWFGAVAMHELARFREAWAGFAAEKPYWRAK